MENKKTKKLKPLAGMTLDELRRVTSSLGMPKFTATQLAQWIYGKRVTDFDQMLNISKANRQRLEAEYCVGLVAPDSAVESADGTVKYLFDVGEGRKVESVYIPEADRATLCISSQKGCRMNCYFCMTGRQGFHGNLTANQIINQVLSIPQTHSLTNIVFAPIVNGLSGVSLSANWMWPCRSQEGEDARLYSAVKALSDFCCALNINVPTGKDSLSMSQQYPDGQKVIAPGTVIVSSGGQVTDVRKVIGPVMVNDKKASFY